MEKYVAMWTARQSPNKSFMKHGQFLLNVPRYFWHNLHKTVYTENRVMDCGLPYAFGFEDGCVIPSTIFYMFV